jgi:cytochrome c oxidase subunit 2
MQRTTTFLVAGLTVALSLADRGAGAAQSQDPERRVIRISAERFVFTPSRVTLEVGEEVELRVESDDTAHGFRLVGTDTDVVVPKRGAGEASVIFKATTPGRVTFECSRLCGAGHHFMRGEIVVVEAGGR